MKKLTLIGAMLFGLCFLAIQCRNDDDTDEFPKSSSGEQYIVDSFSTWLSNADGQEVWFGAAAEIPKYEIKDLTFNIDFIEFRYVFHPETPSALAFEAMAVPAPFSILQIDDIEITSDKDIETTDGLHVAGTDLSSLFMYKVNNVSISWENEIDLLTDELETAYGRPLIQGLTAMLDVELKEHIDQHFTFTFTHLNGESVSAISPRVVAR